VRTKGIIPALAAAAGISALAALSACAGAKAPAAGGEVEGRRFSLSLVPGPEYETTTRRLLFSLPIYPQVASWIETPRGEYVGTIYVTAKGARKAWVSAPKGGRPEALPVWTRLTATSRGRADAVSGPTPAGETKRSSGLAAGLKDGRYVVKLEVNRSYDYNERFDAGTSGVAGQPSIVYECELEVGDAPSKATFKPIGTGSVDGSDGSIRPGLEGITTALRILDGAEISCGEAAL
jgi:hypothetical protein